MGGTSPASNYDHLWTLPEALRQPPCEKCSCIICTRRVALLGTDPTAMDTVGSDTHTPHAIDIGYSIYRTGKISLTTIV